MELDDTPSSSQLAAQTSPDGPSSPPVFFGPVTSPEKRYAAGLPTRTPPPPSPVRRSLRLSLAPPLLFPSTPMRAVSEEEVSEVENFLEIEALKASEAEEGSSGEDRNAMLDDEPEPSSALAEKISRAHDNPSPPPKFSLLPPEHPSSAEQEPRASSSKLIDISFEVASPAPQRSHGSDLLALVSPFKVTTPPPPSSPNAVNSDTDLISFDDSLEVPGAPAPDVQEAIPTVVTVEDDEPMESPVEPVAATHTAPSTPPPPTTTQYLDITTPTPRRRSPRLSKAPATLNEPPRPSSPSPSVAVPLAIAPVPVATTPPPQASSSTQIPSPRRSASPRRHQALQQTERLASLSPTTTGLLSNLMENVTPNPFNTPSVVRRPASNAPMEHSPSPPRRPVQLQRPPSASPEKSARPTMPPSPAKRVPIFKPPSSGSGSFSHIPAASASHSPPRRVPIASSPSKPLGSFTKSIGTPQRVPRPRAGSAEPTGSISPRKPPMLTFRPPSRAASDSAVSEGGKTTGIKELPFPLRAATIPEENEAPPGVEDALLAPSEDSMHGATSLETEAPPLLSEGGMKPASNVIKSPPPAGPTAGKTKSNLRQPSTLASSRIPRKPYARPASADKDKAKAKESGPAVATTAASRARSKEPAAGPSTTVRSNVRAARNPVVSKPIASKEPEVIEVSSDDAPSSGPEKVAPAKVPVKGRLVKPISREKGVEKDKAKAKETRPTTIRRAAAPAQARLVRSTGVNRTDSESSSSDAAASGQAARTMSPLKRKRSDDGSPSGAQAYVLLGSRTASGGGPQTMRKVVKQTAPAPAPSPSPNPTPVPTAAPSSPEKKARGGPARKVAPATRRAAASKSGPARSALPRLVKSPTPDPPAPVNLMDALTSQRQDSPPPATDGDVQHPIIVVDTPSSPAHHATPIQGVIQDTIQEVVTPVPEPAPTPIPASTPVPPPSPSPAPELAGGRRTRSGRTTNDVFGPIVRRGVADGGPFASMSATALRALTTVNTTRNQNYGVAVLATEVVRKQGPRPESPQTKVRSLEEKRKEAAQRGRSERAARRARRQSGEDSTDDEGGADGAEEQSWAAERHRLGAGDDEEYVTPEKARPAKRLKFDGTDSNEAAQVNVKRERRVRWDKGLFSTFYFDDTPGPLVLPSRAASAATFPKPKGGLAGSARALRLDGLGNALSESPLKGLEPENVVVKKFVYDDDEGAEPIVQVEPVETKGKGKRRSSRS
ncbi:unnamed protein product [Peniophora sp. CBMAI 1063]|nr:unnamed protein product [Peniophora sp. CBMAI 1063]